MIRIQRKPAVDTDAALALAREHFGLDGFVSPLPGERDRNFLLATPGGRRFVVKVSSPEEPEEVLRFECDLLAWLGEGGSDLAPRLVRARSGELLVRGGEGPDGPWRVRVLEHVPGKVLAAARPRSAALLEEVGGALAALGLALESYPGRPPAREGFDWALARAGDVMERGIGAVGDPRRGALLREALHGFRSVESRLAELPARLVHGDANDHNVLVSAAADGPRRVTAILDFGDAHAAPAVFDPAIAAAYALLDQPDPIQAAAALVAGYHRVSPLDEAELDVLFPLLRARLGASVAVSAWRRRESHEVDADLLVSEAPAWEALERLADLHPRLARGILRDACGFPACPRCPGLVTWLEGREHAPVLDLPAPGGVRVLDLSVGSPDAGIGDTDDTPSFSERLFRRLREEGATVGVGRYGEPRAFYHGPAFAGRAGERPEHRTIHLGVDLFVEPGAEVRAPLAGRVQSVRDHAARLDYGPTVILEHEGPEGPFWTLYGHLERASVAGLQTGARVETGAAFARVGPFPENGDWPPHLHFQIVTDLLDSDGSFPGVAMPRERAVWKSFSPDPAPVLRLPAPSSWAEPPRLEERRRMRLGPSLGLSYREPIHVVRGRGACLYDVLGREYLDCVNNVAHVGHEHPRVVRAGQRQMSVLNTNTRYLHEALVAYAERLAGLLPPRLSTLFFVSSGSEANELALRMARAFTGARGVVVLEGGYHGNTQGLVDVSHYKFAGPGGKGPPPWVGVAPMPDDFRGRYRRDDPERAARFAAHVGEAFSRLEAGGHGAAAFLCESLLSCGGQVEPPAGYLAEAYRLAREAGAVCIADEVQVGFGRVGSHFWGFESQGAEPDLVTLGKPMGNGHPVGAVAATREVADAFADGMEYFSTFGGNPVSAAIGLAVLEVIEEEGLQAHAARVGGELRAGLEEVAGRHPVVGDVRGRGLFLGVELVAEPASRSPAGGAARYVVERMKERGILLSADGPDANVLKVKPPMPFSRADARRLVESLDEVLGEDFVVEAVVARARPAAGGAGA